MASLLSIALSSDTRLSEIREFNSGDSELAVGESGTGSLLDFTKAPPKKKPLLDGLGKSPPPEPPLMGGGGAESVLPTPTCCSQDVVERQQLGILCAWCKRYTVKQT